MAFSVGDTIELSIEKLSFNGGRGVARIDGFVFFIPFVIPGEKVLAKVTQVKKSYGTASVIEIIDKSPLRIEPRCDVFGVCGGCSWQHIPYKNQVEYKKQLLQEFVQKISPNTLLNDFYACEKPWNYRNRIQVNVKNNKIGFHQRKSNKLVNFSECHITEDKINIRIDELRKQKKINNQRLEIALTKDHETLVVDKPWDKNNIFSQVNEYTNKNLIAKTVELAKKLRPKRIYDLYCGQGNFTFPLKAALPSCKLTGIEATEAAVNNAKSVSKQQNIEITWVSSPCEDFLKNLPSLNEQDLVLVDPPRTGLSNLVTSELVRLQPENLIYISCDPSTLTRDLRLLLDKLSLKITFISGFDMFPQTDHTETLCLLSKA